MWFYISRILYGFWCTKDSLYVFFHSKSERFVFFLFLGKIEIIFQFPKILLFMGEPRSRPCYKKRVYSTQPPLLFQGFSRSSSAKIGRFVKPESKKNDNLDTFWNSLQIWRNEVISLYHWTPWRYKLKNWSLFSFKSRNQIEYLYIVFLPHLNALNIKKFNLRNLKKRDGDLLFWFSL